MRRVVTGIATCALLTVATACTSGSDTDASDTPTKHVAVEPDEVVRHEAASGTPISFGIEVPDGAVQVGPLIRQRRVDVESVIDAADGRANAFTDNRDDETSPETRDPEEPTPPDFTTAMLRVDDDPSEVVHATISELADALEGSEIDADHWRDYCAVDNGVYVGCRLAARGTTDDDEHVAVELTVYPGDHGSRLAAAGSLLRPVMVLTLEQVAKPADHGDGEPPDSQAREEQNAIDALQAQRDAIAQERAKNAQGKTGVSDASDESSDSADDDDADTGDEGGDPTDEGETEDGEESPDEQSEPKWPTMKRERPAMPGDWILTPEWKIRPNTEVILSSATPKVAMLAVKDGADTERIARAYVRAFADEATTPKIDEVEDRNERSITYTPRNDGSGPAVAVTAVATGRGNYIELLFSDGSNSPPGPTPGYKRDKSGGSEGDKPDKDGSDKPSAKPTTSSTG